MSVNSFLFQQACLALILKLVAVNSVSWKCYYRLLSYMGMALKVSCAASVDHCLLLPSHAMNELLEAAYGATVNDRGIPHHPSSSLLPWR